MAVGSLWIEIAYVQSVLSCVHTMSGNNYNPWESGLGSGQQGSSSSSRGGQQGSGSRGGIGAPGIGTGVRRVEDENRETGREQLCLPDKRIKVPLGGKFISNPNTITAQELQCIRHLREECNTQGIPIRSAFHLAKYVIVASQKFPTDMSRVVSHALTELREAEVIRRKFLDKSSPQTSWETLNEIESNLYVPCGYDSQNRLITAFNFTRKFWNWFDGDSATEYKRHLFASACVAMYESSLADIAEIRRGQVLLLNFTGMNDMAAAQILGLCRIGKHSVSPSLANNVKQLNIITDERYVKFMRDVVGLLPMESGTCVASSLKNLAAWGFEPNKTQLGPQFGGSFRRDFQQFFNERRLKLQHSISTFVVDD